MAFAFTLQGLLRVRESFERREAQEVAVATAEVRRLSALLSAIRERLACAADEMAQLLRRGTTGAELQLRHLEKMMLERRQRDLAESVAAAVTELRNQQERWRLARQKRKILDQLRHQQLMDFLLTQRRREQQQLDDAFLLRRSQETPAENIA